MRRWTLALIVLLALPGCGPMGEFARGLTGQPTTMPGDAQNTAYSSGGAIGDVAVDLLPIMLPGGIGAALAGGIALLRGRKQRKGAEAVTAEIVRQVQALLDGPVGRVKFAGADGKAETVAEAAKAILATQHPKTKALVDRVQKEMGAAKA